MASVRYTTPDGREVVIEITDPNELLQVLQVISSLERGGERPSPQRHPDGVAIKQVLAVLRLIEGVVDGLPSAEVASAAGLKSAKGMARVIPAWERALAVYALKVADVAERRRYKGQSFWVPGPKCSEAIRTLEDATGERADFVSA